MAENLSDLINSFGKETGLTSVERLPNIDEKRFAIANASAVKQAGLLKPEDYSTIAAGVGNQLGAGSMGEVEKDLRTLDPTQLGHKYGFDLAQQMRFQLGDAISRHLNDQVGTRSIGGTTYDLTTGVAGGFAGSVADIGSFGVGLANDEFGAAMANQTAEYRKTLEESQSDSLNAARRANRAKNALSQRDNQLEYEQNLASGQSKTSAKVERFFSDFGDTILNADDPTILAQGTAEGVGSLLVAGPLSKGIKAGTTVLAGGTETVLAAKAASAISKAAGTATPFGARAVSLLDAASLPLAIGTMEAGSVYTQTTNEIMSMQPEQLLQISEQYRQKVAEYESQGMLREEALRKAQIQLASETGQKAAAMQFPLAAATGLLTKYAEAPFKVGSAKQALTNIALAEPLEEAVQGTTGSLTQDIAIKDSVDPNRDVGKGAGEQAATGALYGLGAAGVVQGPGVAAKAVGGTVRAVGSGLNQLAEKNTNTRNAKIDEQTIQEAGTAVDTSAADEAELLAAVDATDATPEQKEQAKADISSLQQAQQIDPNIDLEGVPDNLRAAVIGSKSRAEAIVRLAQEMGKAQDDGQVLQAAAVMNELLSSFDELKAKNNEVLASLPADDPAAQKYQKNLSLIESVRSNPSVKKATEAVQAYIAATAEQMKPVSDTAIETPAGQQQAKDIVTVATLAPNKGNLDAVNQVLQHNNDGKVPLNDFQLKALKNSKALLTAAKKLAEQKKANGLNKVRDVVSDEVMSRDDTKNVGAETEKRSALEFTQRVYHAYKAGDYALAAAHLREFGMFVKHMKNKVDAINTHYEKGAKVGILNREKEDYQTLLPPDFTGGRVGEVSAKSIGISGVFAAPTQADKIDLIQSIALEAEAVADIYNSLVDAYALDGVNPIDPSTLDAELLGKPDEVVARYKASLNTRQGVKSKPVKNEPTEADQNVIAELSSESRGLEEDSIPLNVSNEVDKLLSRLEAVKEFIPAAYKGVKQLIGEGRLDQAEKWIKEGEDRATTAEEAAKLSDEALETQLNILLNTTNRTPVQEATFKILDAEMTTRGDVGQKDPLLNDFIDEVDTGVLYDDDERDRKLVRLNAEQREVLQNAKDFIEMIFDFKLPKLFIKVLRHNSAPEDRIQGLIHRGDALNEKNPLGVITIQSEMFKGLLDVDQGPLWKRAMHVLAHEIFHQIEVDHQQLKNRELFDKFYQEYENATPEGKSLFAYPYSEQYAYEGKRREEEIFAEIGGNLTSRTAAMRFHFPETTEIFFNTVEKVFEKDVPTAADVNQVDTVSEDQEDFDESSLEDVFTTEEPALIDQKYKIVRQQDSKFELNNGQKNAFQQVMGFLKGKTQVFSIIGSAGTGKTTIVDTVLASLAANGLAGRNIILSSPTHRANGVTRSKNDPGLEIVTLHNLLGLLPPEDKLPGEEKLKDSAAFRQRLNEDGEEISAITNNSLIIVDEASMINDALFKALMRTLEKYPNAKVIFLGDAAQLKPVGQAAVSKALESDVVNETNRAELTKVERAKNPSLLAESVRLRKNKDFTKTSRMTKTGQGVSFTRSTTVFVDMFVNYLKSNEFKENPLLARIVAFSNNRVKEYNQKIRDQLYGKGAAPFVVGELLMGYKTYGEPDLITKLATINNGLDYLVTDVSEDIKINYLGFSLKAVRLTIKHTLSYKNGEVFQEPQTITVLKPGQDFSEVTALIKKRLSDITAIQDQTKKREAFEKLKEQLSVVALPFDITHEGKEVVVAKDFDYGYAHTIHKSQGGTYKYVFVDNMRMSIKDKQSGDWVTTPDAPQLRYVGMTRAQEGAYVLTEGNIVQGKPYKGKAEPSRDEPSVVVPEAVVNAQPTTPVAEPIVEQETVTPVVQPAVQQPAVVTPVQKPVPVDEEVDFLEEIDTDGLVEPAFTGPEKPTSLVSYFKDLISHGVNRFTNYFHKSFVLPEEEKLTSRLLGTQSPHEFVSNLLFGSKERLEQTLGQALKYDFAPQVVAAYKKFLSTDAKNPQSFGGVLNAVNKSLNSWLAEPNSKKDPRTRLQMLREGVALHTLKTGHALNILEEKDGKYSYNQELIEGAVLAAMQWLIESSDREVILKDDEVKKLTGEDIENVSEEVLAQLKAGFDAAQIKMAITSKIKAYWGVRVAPGALQGYSDGIPEAVASEILQALIDTGFLKEETVTLRVPEFDEEGNPVLDEDSQQKERVTRFNRYSPIELDEALKDYPTAIEDIAVTDPEQVIYLHDDEVPVAATRMNNPQERNTKSQVKAIEISQRKKFFPNSHTIDAIFALGEDGVAFLFGGGVINLEDKPWYNKNRAATIEGKNKTTVSAFKALESLLQRMDSRATALGIPVTELAIRYAVNASKNGRLFMLGSHNPQASKLMRAAIATTWSVLNLNTPEHMSNFKLAMAQALGIKVHNLPLNTVGEQIGSIESVDKLLTKLEPAIARFQSFLGNKENGLDYEALAQEFVEAGAPMTPASFNAVLEWSRSQMEGTDKSAFRTAVSLEADGITNGPINSMMLLTQGKFTPEFIKNMMRGGISFSDAKSMAQLRLDHGLIDLYSESAKNAESVVYDWMKFFEGHDKDVSANQKALIRTMRTLLPNLSYSYNQEEKRIEFKFERGLLKNPLTITIYGSSANGIAGKVVGEVLDAYYDLLSQASDRYTNGVKDREGNFIKPDTIWEAMFPALTSEEAKKTYDQLNEDFNLLTNSTVNQTWEYGNKVWSVTRFPTSTKKQTAQEFTITSQQFNQLRGTMLHTFVGPMVDGINQTLGQGLLDTVDQIKTISQIQSVIYAQMFRNELDKLLQEREAEYKATGQTWKQNGFVSKEDVRTIVKKLNRFAPILRTGDQSFSLNKNEKLDSDTYAYSESLRGRFATAPNMNMPAQAGVGGIPATAIGFGDAFMIQDAVLSEILERTLEVFDGVEMPLDKIEEFSEQLNKSVYNSYKANPMSNFSTMFNTFLEGSEQIKELLIEETIKAKGMDASKIDAVSPTLSALLKTLRKKVGMPYDLYQLRIPKTAENTEEFVDRLMGAILSQQSQLTATAEDIDIRHQVMREVGMSVDQMAAGAAPYYNGQPLLNTTNPDEIAKILDARYEELKLATAKARKARAAQDAEEAAKPKSETSELGEVHPSGARVLTWNAIQKLASFLGLSKDQQLMYDEIIKAHADSGIVVVTGSKAQIAKYRLQAGIPALASGSNPTGEFVISSDGVPTIFLYKGQAETLVHELIHAATFQLMLAYYNGALKKNTVAGKAMQNLETLMQEFMADLKTGTDPAVNDVRAAIATIENDKSKSEPVRKAMMLNEFIAWTLANQKLAKKLENKTLGSKLLTFGEKVLKSLRQLLRLNEKNTFLNNLQFNAAVIIHAAPSLRQEYNDIVLQHNPNPTSNPRLTRIREALINNVVNHISNLYGAKKVLVNNPNARDIIESTKYSNYVADVFKLSDEQRLTFATLVMAMTTQGQLDSSILVRAQELYTHVIQNLDAAKLADPSTTDQQVRESEGLPKLNILLGKAGFTDKADRSTLLSTFLGLAIVDDQFRDLLSKLPVPKTQKTPGKTLNAKFENLGYQVTDGLSKVLTGERNSSSVTAAIDNLADQLHTLTFHEKTRLEATVAKVGNMVNQGNDWVVAKKDALAEKGTKFGKKLGTSNNRPTRVLGAAIRAAAGVASAKEGNEQAEAAIENLNKLDSRFGKRTIIDVLGRTEKNASIYDLIKPVRSFVQQIRQQFREHIPQYIATKFSRVITPEEYATMFRALGKTDIAVLLSSMSVDDVAKLLTSTTEQDTQIANFEEQLRSADPANWALLEKKMKQLAKYMNTTVTGNKLLRNADAVANLLGERTKGTRLVDPAFVSAVDQLVTLYAIKDLNQKDKSTILSLVQREATGVKFIVDYLATQRKEELDKITGVTKFNHFKGYIPSDPKEQGDLIVADNNKASNLAIYGYVKVGAYKAHPNDPDKSARSYYYSPVAQKAIVSQGIIQNVRHTVSGVDASHGFSTGKTAGRITNPLLVARIAKQLQDTNNIENLMPLYNEDGDLFAFERSLDPKMLEKLDQSQHIAKMIGVWRGRQVEEIESEKLNKKLVQVLKEKWDAAPASERDQFVNLNDPRELTVTEREAVKLMSSSMKTLIKDTFGDDGFYVPKDMLIDVVGYRNASVGDFITGNTEWSSETQKAVRTLMLAAFGDKAFKYFVMSEQRIQSVMTDARQTIVVKSIIIPMYNIMSNSLHLVSRGVPVQMIVKGGLQKVSEINHYTKSKVRQTELEAELRAEKNELKRRRLEVELQSIKDSHGRMSIWPLIQAGEFSTIADVGMTAEDLELTSGKLSEWVEKKIDKLPPVLQTAAKYGYVSRDTALFKGLQKSVQYGDFVAKAVLYDHLTKNKKKTPAEALAQITEEFVNYDRLPGRARGGLENLGLLWFYNYKLRTIKVALSVLRNNPLHAFIAMNLPVPDGVGMVETDNLLGVAADGNLSYSMGPGMALHAINLNPAVNLFN